MRALERPTSGVRKWFSLWISSYSLMLQPTVNSQFEDEEDPASTGIKLKLAKVYENLGLRQEALELVTFGRSSFWLCGPRSRG